MEMTYNGTLVMPKSYVVVDNNEMEYVDGGVNLKYNIAFATKVGSLAKATAMRVARCWKKISIVDLAAEIFTHSVAYYYGGVFLALLSSLGYAQGIASSILGGIDVQNGLDEATIFGIKRYHLYRTVYALFPSI